MSEHDDAAIAAAASQIGSADVMRNMVDDEGEGGKVGDDEAHEADDGELRPTSFKADSDGNVEVVEQSEPELLILEDDPDPVDPESDELAKEHYVLSNRLAGQFGLGNDEAPGWNDLPGNVRALMAKVFDRMLEERESLRQVQPPPPTTVEAGAPVPAATFARAAERMMAAVSVNYSPARVKQMAQMAKKELGIELEGEIPAEVLPSAPCELYMLPGGNWATDDVIGFYMDENSLCLGFRVVGGGLIRVQDAPAALTSRLPTGVRLN